MATFENWGDYFWPGQIDECRRNLLDLHDPAALEAAERQLTAVRAAELAVARVTGRAEGTVGEIAGVSQTFDLDHLRAVHRHLFQDVYEWAGQLRVTELVRPSADPNAPAHQFIPPESIEQMAERLFPLADPERLAELPAAEQVDRLAQVYAGVNVLHPFVEGNGRTQRIFLNDLAAAAGLRVDWAQMLDQNQVMAEAFTVGYRPVAEALQACVTRDSDVSTVDPEVGPASLEQLDARRLMAESFPTPAAEQLRRAGTREPGSRSGDRSQVDPAARRPRRRPENRPGPER